MNTYKELTKNHVVPYFNGPDNSETVHATMSSEPGRENMLEKAVLSLLPQVDTIHVFLNGFEQIPDFLANQKIFVTKSQDFGNLGECGKYYWVGDLKGFHFICSDSLVYPPNYVEHMRMKLIGYHFRCVVGNGGNNFKEPITNFRDSVACFSEIDELSDDIVLPVLNDSSIAYHSKMLKISRHLLYQSELSSFWFSIAALEQNVPLVCCQHPANWLKRTNDGHEEAFDKQTEDYKSFLLNSYFNTAHKHLGNIDINNYFDCIYVINLDRRPDRWENVIRQTQQHSINVSRFKSVNGATEPFKSQWEKYFCSPMMQLPEGIEPITTFREKYLNYRHYFTRIHFMESKLGRRAVQSPGAWGYLLSYRNILKEAILNHFQRIIIFDDDLMLHKHFRAEYTKRMQLINDDWKMIKLGAMQHHWEPSWITWENELMYHCNGSSIASHAVCIDSKVFLPLLHYCEKMDLPVDEGAIFHIQNVYSGQCYVFYPNLVIQDIGNSDINSSALTVEEMRGKNNLFRWKYEDYGQ